MDAGAGFFYQWNTGDQTQTVNILYPDTFVLLLQMLMVVLILNERSSISL
ncbi:MAG: hypothetical protein IPI10_18585 [Bacteroidetes bacterium]|nr:hypothetical protein [Bacteroidota bacterium]